MKETFGVRAIAAEPIKRQRNAVGEYDARRTTFSIMKTERSERIEMVLCGDFATKVLSSDQWL